MCACENVCMRGGQRSTLGVIPQEPHPMCFEMVSGGNLGLTN